MSEVEAKVRVRSKIAVRIAVRRRFDFDHPRAQIRKQRGRVGTGDEGRTLDDGDVFDDFGGHRITSSPLIFHGDLPNANTSDTARSTLESSPPIWYLFAWPLLGNLIRQPRSRLTNAGGGPPV